MAGIFHWAYAAVALTISAAIVLRAMAIVRACTAGLRTPHAHSRMPLSRQISTDTGSFFERTTAAVLHTVLVVSFLLMLADLAVYSTRALFFDLPQSSFYHAFSTLNAGLAAAAIVSAAIFLLRRTLLRLPRFLTLTPAQRTDGYMILILEMVSAGSYLAVYAGWPYMTYLHYGIMLIFGLYLTYSKHLHIFLAPVFMAVFGRREAFRPDNMPEVAEGLDVLQGTASMGAPVAERMGARDFFDLPRRGIVSAFACTECGRCDEACPVVKAGKAFSPRQAVAAVRKSAVGKGKQHLFGDLISGDTAFACISCEACLQTCPIGIDPMDLLLQTRRYATLEEGSAPPEYGQTAAAIDATGNPWGLRPAPAADDGFPLADPEKPAEYLLWRGVMGIYDSEGREAVRQIARSLNEAGVSWAVLPENEECDTADILRYTGDELTFVISARKNIATLASYGVKNIITPCPHSLAAFRNYYPSLGGSYKTWHTAEFLCRLMDEGCLKPQKSLEGKTIVYHDPCRLSRTGVTEAPRRIIEAMGGRLVETPLYGRRSMCCGGGDFFSSDPKTAKIAALRMEQLAATGADLIVTACPFCRQMLSSAGGIPVKELSVKGSH